MFTAILPAIRDELRRMWLHRRLGLAVMALLFLAGAAYVMTLPSYYTASGQLYVNKATPLAAATEGVSLHGDGSANPVFAAKTLLNDRNLEDVLRSIDPAAATLGKRDMVIAVNRLRDKVKVLPDSGDGFIDLQATDNDPARAAAVAQLLLDRFIASSVERNRAELSKTASFLDQQIADCRLRMAQTQTRLFAVRQRVAGLARPVRTPGAATMSTTAAPRMAAAQEQVTALQARLSSLRAVYTDEYPDVIMTRRQLADALAQRNAAAQAAPGRGVVANRAAGGGAAASALPPALAADLADAERSDEAQRAHCQQLIDRRQAAQMTQAVLSSDTPSKYLVTSSPVVPAAPAGPNRGVYLALAGLAAVGGGLGAAYLRALAHGAIVSPRELEAACQLPVVTTVAWDPAWATDDRRAPTPTFGRSLRRTRTSPMERRP